MEPPDDTPREFAHESTAGNSVLGRVRSVAQAITDRVRTAIGHHPPAANTSGNIDPNRPLRVLVVDDNPDAADALAAVAELLGCVTRASYGGPDALDALRVEMPDVLLLDLSMPVVSGLEVADHARRLAGGRPLLLVATTGLGSLEDRTATALAGFQFHLIKPIDTPALRSVLDQFRALRRASVLDLPPGPATAPA